MSAHSSTEIWVATTTVATAEQAQALARDVVARGLAACVQVEPVMSTYRWQGELCADAEQRISFKTSARCLPALREAVLAAHPYTLPQWLAWPVQASPAYAAWVIGDSPG